MNTEDAKRNGTFWDGGLLADGQIKRKDFSN